MDILPLATAWEIYAVVHNSLSTFTTKLWVSSSVPFMIKVAKYFLKECNYFLPLYIIVQNQSEYNADLSKGKKKDVSK